MDESARNLADAVAIPVDLSKTGDGEPCSRTDLEVNTLHYGDNLKVLRERIPEASVDLVYLDPPFNSNRNYSVLFEDRGVESAAQIKAFNDTWKWDEAAVAAFGELTGPKAASFRVPPKLTVLIESLARILGESEMAAYIVMMAIRLVELHRVLKSTGSLYLHCDPTASHYLKLVLDAIFGPTAFRNEIIWRRTPFSGSSKALAQQLPKSHDVILFYSRGDKWKWNCPTVSYTDEYLARFKWEDARGKYRKTSLKTYSAETLERLRTDDRLIEPVKAGAGYSYKQYLSESSGEKQIDDLWTDINMLNPVSKERLGYPTQKPVALLTRIIESSTDIGDVVLDPFCGCGTTIAAAQELGRPWIGIDITHLAINLIKNRLKLAYPSCEYKERGAPEDLSGAHALALQDRHQFEWWALGKIDAWPSRSGENKREGKKGADHGIDGEIQFTTHGKGSHKIIVSVKSGKNLHTDAIRDLRGTLDRDKAAIGVLLTLHDPTREMEKEARIAGMWEHPDLGATTYPRIQIITVEDVFSGKRVAYPQLPTSVKQAQRGRHAKRTEQLALRPSAPPPRDEEE